MSLVDQWYFFQRMKEEGKIEVSQSRVLLCPLLYFKDLLRISITLHRSLTANIIIVLAAIEVLSYENLIEHCLCFVSG